MWGNIEINSVWTSYSLYFILYKEYDGLTNEMFRNNWEQEVPSAFTKVFNQSTKRIQNIQKSNYEPSKFDMRHKKCEKFRKETTEAQTSAQYYNFQTSSVFSLWLINLVNEWTCEIGLSFQPFIFFKLLNKQCKNFKRFPPSHSVADLIFLLNLS